MRCRPCLSERHGRAFGALDEALQIGERPHPSVEVRGFDPRRVSVASRRGTSCRQATEATLRCGGQRDVVAIEVPTTVSRTSSPDLEGECTRAVSPIQPTLGSLGSDLPVAHESFCRSVLNGKALVSLPCRVSGLGRPKQGIPMMPFNPVLLYNLMLLILDWLWNVFAWYPGK